MTDFDPLTRVRILALEMALGARMVNDLGNIVPIGPDAAIAYAEKLADFILPPRAERDPAPVESKP